MKHIKPFEAFVNESNADSASEKIESLPKGSTFDDAKRIDGIFSKSKHTWSEVIEAFEKMANLATKAGVEGHPIRIRTPLIRMTKAQIISMGTGLGVDYSRTVSCYQADEEGRACGYCDSCRLRKKGFADAGIVDPTQYFPPHLLT